VNYGQQRILIIGVLDDVEDIPFDKILFMRSIIEIDVIPVDNFYVSNASIIFYEFANFLKISRRYTRKAGFRDFFYLNLKDSYFYLTNGKQCTNSKRPL
jgi:hypothetical protein